MKNSWTKYLILISLLVIYINRGLFVASSSYQENSYGPHDNHEVNSILEWIINLTGNYNSIDEDGNSPENYNAAKTITPFVCHTFVQILEYHNQQAETEKILFPFDERIPAIENYARIEHPPQA